MRSPNRSKRYAASCGPAAASGWYWTEKLVSRAVGVAELEALDDVVVEAHVADRDLAELGRRRALERGVDGEAVVVGGDLDLAGGAVHHRLVDAAVAVLQLVGAEAERAAEELVAEADAEVGDAGAQRVLQQLAPARWWPRGRRDRWRRTARRGRPPARPRWSRSPGSTCTSMPRSLIIRGVLDLMPRSTAATVKRLSPDGGDDVGLLRADGLAEVGAGHLARLQHPRQQALGVGLRRGDADAHRTALAQVAGQRAGVDAADADDALVAQVVVEAAHAAPAGRDAGGVAHDVAGDPDARGLGVLVVHAGVADVRGRHHDDLAVVAGVGQRLLVAGHAGGEDRLAEGLALGSERLTAKGATVLEDHERCGVGRQSHAVPPSPPHGTDR